MTPDARSRMVDAAAILLAKHGYQATSFSTVLAASGAPRGSIYHHFPGGKDELIAAAIEVTGERAVGLLDSLDGESAGEVLDAFMGLWRAVLTRSSFGAGCSVLAVTVSADDQQIIEKAARIFGDWRDRLAALFASDGLSAVHALEFATAVIAGSEGAVVLARAERSLEPFDRVHGGLRRMLGSYPS